MAAIVRKHLTLLLLHAGDQLLLGMKKKGFGAGKYNGFGGKIEPGETALQAAVREMHEESGVRVVDPTHIGTLLFTFTGSAEHLHVYVFRATQYEGEVAESEEMAPAWFPASSPPLERMWADDAYWLPLALGGKRFTGRFAFDGHSTIVEHELHEVADEAGLGIDAATDLLVTELQTAITA